MRTVPIDLPRSALKDFHVGMLARCSDGTMGRVVFIDAHVGGLIIARLKWWERLACALGQALAAIAYAVRNWRTRETKEIQVFK